jgi:hypothetical protein
MAALADAEGKLHPRHAVVLFTAANATTLSSTTDVLFPGQAVRIVAKPFDVDDILAAVADAERQLGGWSEP